jgi:hypothetical protein
MRCIFCKADSSSSRSREHILPESLGNEEHTLPRGVVCDRCNNYFSRKLEKPILDSPIFQLLRADMQIANKRGRVPAFPSQQGQRLPNYRLMGRFLGKVGLEVLASRVLDVHGWNQELAEKTELDALRDYVRFNVGVEDWPFSFRTLYPVNGVFEEEGTFFEILHEYQLVYTDALELYAVVAILGVEFAMNLGWATLAGYARWLEANDHRSPLYPGAPANPALQSDGASPRR